ncbi:biliverdin-producing heme oxygenase [Oleiharenicola lentus]|uniref:biliverdin-producing heme oxygenase n=1 Tax=Oleiharenicola lentus TaxID=2508720 RepID=UPI003F6656FE
MTLAERLRTDTRLQHEQLEASLGLAKSRAEHLAQLKGFLGFIEPWEQATARSPLAEFYRGREKSAWLREDLKSFGLTDAEIAALPRCQHLPAVDSLPAALGSVYVIEGSTLGGQMISKHLETTLGFSGGSGYRYFRSYGADVGKKWGELRGLLVESSSPENDDRIVAAAGETFAAMGEWFATQPATR